MKIDCGRTPRKGLAGSWVLTMQSWRSNPQQRYQTTSMWGQMSKHLLPDSPSKSQKESCLYWRPMYGTTKPTVCSSLVLCCGKTAFGLLSVRWCVALNRDDMEMVVCGHDAKAQQIHTVTRRLQQAGRWCSCIDPVPLLFLPHCLALWKSWCECGSMLFKLTKNKVTCYDCVSLIIIFHDVFLHASCIHAWSLYM